MKEIVVYGAPWCAFCKTERQWLDSFDISYEYRDISKNEDVMNELIAISGSSSIPVLVAKDEADKIFIVKGFNRQGLSNLLKLK